MSAETTPAIERAYRAMRPDFRKDLDPGILGGLLTVRTGLAAALDVEEMARVLDDHQRVVGPHGLTRSCTCGLDLGPVGNLKTHQAGALRTAILGSDS